MTPLRKRLRRAWQELRGRRSATFAGAEISRLLLDWATSLRSADEEIKGNIRKLRGRARDLARNDGYVRKFLTLLAANVIGPNGFALQSKVKDADGKLVSRSSTIRADRACAAWKSAAVNSLYCRTSLSKPRPSGIASHMWTFGLPDIALSICSHLWRCCARWRD